MSPRVTNRIVPVLASSDRLHPGAARLRSLARGRSASTGGRRLSLRAEVVTHLVKLVAPLVVIPADTDYALAA